MDSFKAFFEQLELLSTEVQVKTESDESINNDEITVDISFNGTTCDYFKKIDMTSSLLISFYERYIATTAVHNALYNNVMLYKRRTFDDLKLCLMIDVIRCYDGLNHSTSLITKEGLGLLLILVKIYIPGVILNFEDLSAVPESIINLDGLIPYISACSDEIGIPSDQSIISTLLQQVSPKSDKLFRGLFYRFCEAIAEADGEISISEKEWLMAILHLDDDDVSNDINIDSIFS